MIPYIVSILAPIMNTVQLLPQLIKTHRTKKVKDLSFYSLLLILFCDVLWLLHGYFIGDLSLQAAGLITLFINLILMVLYFKYR
jgi:MtN3 and saliva related transmembrane protein